VPGQGKPPNESLRLVGGGAGSGVVGVEMAGGGFRTGGSGWEVVVPTLSVEDGRTMQSREKKNCHRREELNTYL
jgi:hypothetical protein